MRRCSHDLKWATQHYFHLPKNEIHTDLTRRDEHNHPHGCDGRRRRCSLKAHRVVFVQTRLGVVILTGSKGRTQKKYILCDHKIGWMKRVIELGGGDRFSVLTI